MTTHANRPPQQSSNEADDDQLKVAHAQGDAYGKALKAMTDEDGAATCRAGEYVNARLPGDGPYDVTARVAAPTFMRHDPINGKRYAEPVTARFEKVRFALGRKPSPNAEPRAADAPTAGTD
jgi:hypothetical protein